MYPFLLIYTLKVRIGCSILIKFIYEYEECSAVYVLNLYNRCESIAL